jgi:hypothetical protein
MEESPTFVVKVVEDLYLMMNIPNISHKNLLKVFLLNMANVAGSNLLK